MAPRLLASCAVAMALALASPSQQLSVNAPANGSLTARSPSLRASGSPALVESEARQLNGMLPPEAYVKQMRPCHVSSDWGPCGTRGAPHEYPGGLHCPENQCCSKTAVKIGQGGGSWCTSAWALCSSTLVYHEGYSYGTCNCTKFGKHCPHHSTCEQNGEQPYCKCNEGYHYAHGQCIEGNAHAAPALNEPEAPVVLPPAVDDSGDAGGAGAEEEGMVTLGCQAGDCRPGLCEFIEGKVKCTCGPGYKTALLNEVKEQCIKSE